MRGKIPDRDDCLIEAEGSKVDSFRDRIVLVSKCPAAEMQGG